MRYTTVTDLTDRAAYSELAEAAAPDSPVVDGELLKLKLSDLSAIENADQDAARYKTLLAEYKKKQQRAGGSSKQLTDAIVVVERKYAVSAAVVRLTRVLDDASAEIDGYIQGRYGTIATPPPVLTVRCLDIALYRLFGGDASSERYLIYKRALDWLSGIAGGKIDLDVDIGAVSDSGIHIRAGTRVFDEHSLKNY